MMFLLFDKEYEMLSDKDIVEKLIRKGYEINFEWEANNGGIKLFYLPEYTVDLKDGKSVPYQLSLFSFTKI